MGGVAPGESGAVDDYGSSVEQWQGAQHVALNAGM
jgi:hypothetical protein